MYHELQKMTKFSILSSLLLLLGHPLVDAFSMQMPIPSIAPSRNDRIVFGTAALSQAEEPFKLLDAAFDKGVRKFDLARTYGQGKSEIVFGEWLKSRRIDHKDIYIITKGGMGEDKYGDPDRVLLDRNTLMFEVESSLDVLNVPYVDMYMYHRDDPRLPVQNLVVWANEIIDQGKTLSWGVSNWSFERFQEAHDFAISEGYRPPMANSPQLSLACPACEVWPTTYSIAGKDHEGQISWYDKHGIELVCWEVLAKGFMAVPDLWCENTVDKSIFEKECEIGTDEWRLQRIQRAYCNEENYRRRRNAVKVAKEHGMSLAQVAALYALSVSPSVSVIMGFLEPNQIDDVEDLHHYFLNKDCVVGDEAVEGRISIVDRREWKKLQDTLQEPGVIFPLPSQSQMKVIPNVV